MEQTPRTPARPDGLRPLGLPRPIHVQLDSNGLPTRLRTNPRAALPLRAPTRPTTNPAASTRPTNPRPPSRPTSARPGSGRSSSVHRSGSTARSAPDGRVFDVLDVSEIWRIAEEWWRDHPIQRTYYRLVLQDGRPLTIFHDETTPEFSENESTTCGGWFQQHY